MRWRTYWNDFLSVLFPSACAGCDAALYQQEDILCTACLYHLPLTNFHFQKDNETAKQLWGKVVFDKATSMLYFSTGSPTQRLIQKIKYQGQPQIAYFLGKMYGKTLQEVWGNCDFECVVPVPLHKSKQRQRGYNQSSYFGKGLSETLGIAFCEDELLRTVRSESQTQKSRDERYSNVEDVFSIANSSQLVGKHVLLVDDVITTGATIASAAQTLVAVEGCRVSIVTLARA